MIEPALPPGNRYIVTGGRDFTDRRRLYAALDRLHGKNVIALIAHGKCPTGADLMAEEWCLDNDVECWAFPADWSKGKAGGPIRNGNMLRIVQAHGVVAFPTGGPGTADMIRQAEAAGVKVWIP